MNGWGDTVQVFKPLRYLHIQMVSCKLFWLTSSVPQQIRLCILMKMPPSVTTGATTWCLSGLRWPTLRCSWPPLKIWVTLMKLSGQVCILNFRIASKEKQIKEVIITLFSLSRSAFHPDWNHHHGNSSCPCDRRSHFRCHHVRRACQVLQDGGPPAPARGPVPALRQRQKPVCCLSRCTEPWNTPVCLLSLLLQCHKYADC